MKDWSLKHFFKHLICCDTNIATVQTLLSNYVYIFGRKKIQVVFGKRREIEDCYALSMELKQNKNTFYFLTIGKHEIVIGIVRSRDCNITFDDIIWI